MTGCAVRAGSEEVGLVSDPEFVRLGYRSGGRSFESIGGRFPSSVTDGLDLQRSETLVDRRYGLGSDASNSNGGGGGGGGDGSDGDEDGEE